jgi:hypothetical protein
MWTYGLSILLNQTLTIKFAKTKINSIIIAISEVTMMKIKGSLPRNKSKSMIDMNILWNLFHGNI